MEKLRVVSGHTTYPNSPETDVLREVLNDVTVEFADSTRIMVRVLATDPADAMDCVIGNMDAASIRKLPQITDDQSSDDYKNGYSQRGGGLSYFNWMQQEIDQYKRRGK